jgi:hypothetical protein
MDDWGKWRLNFQPRMGTDERGFFQARRAGIFVDCGQKMNQAPFRSDIIGICRPDGAEIFVWGCGSTMMPRRRRWGW